MNTKIKATVVTFLLFLTATTCLIAQEKYEYATLRAMPNFNKPNGGINLYTKDGIEFFGAPGYAEVYQQLVKKVNELAGQGWEVFGVNESNPGQGSLTVAYQLRRKAKE